MLYNRKRGKEKYEEANKIYNAVKRGRTCLNPIRHKRYFLLWSGSWLKDLLWIIFNQYLSIHTHSNTANYDFRQIGVNDAENMLCCVFEWCVSVDAVHWSFEFIKNPKPYKCGNRFANQTLPQFLLEIRKSKQCVSQM